MTGISAIWCENSVLSTNLKNDPLLSNASTQGQLQLFLIWTTLNDIMSKLFPFVAYLAKFFCNTTMANWSHSTKKASFEANALICQVQKLTFSCSISLWSMVDYLNWKFRHFRPPKSKRKRLAREIFPNILWFLTL